MGIRLTYILAVVFTFHLEAWLHSAFPSIHLYRRDIDDIFICADTENMIASLLNTINSAHQDIKLTRDNVSEKGWLPFLNA